MGLVFIFQDYTKMPTTIQQIEKKHLKMIKQWLDECDIIYAEQQMPLNWQNALKVIRDDLPSFIEKGGWEWAHDDSKYFNDSKARRDNAKRLLGGEGEADDYSSEDFDNNEAEEEDID